MSTDALKRNRIAALNDAFRRAGPGCDWYATSGVHTCGPTFALRAFRAVMAFDSFTADNDPYGEHDFGSFSLDGERLFWKIDCYDQSLQYGSDDPADAAVTRRVMTIMLAEEY